MVHSTMQLKDLTLKHMRIYEEVSLSLHPRLNVFTGNNAQGKTTVLESIYMLSYTRSHRTTSDKEIIQQAKPFAKVTGTTTNQSYELVMSPAGKTVKLNGGSVDKLSAFVGDLSVVMFAPEDLDLLKGPPKLRRQFLNMQGTHQDRSLMGELSRYQTLLKDRNHRIKQVSTLEALKNDGLFQILTQRLAYSAETIMMKRKQFLTQLSTRLTPIYQSIANDGLTPTIQYVPSMNFYDYAEQLRDSIDRDFHTKTTNLGIHRDDFVINHITEDFTLHASQGQMRTLAIALKLALVAWMKEFKKVIPLVLLDDVFSELDANRQNALLTHLDAETQVFITTTDLNLIKRENLENYSHFSINQGKVQVSTYE